MCAPYQITQGSLPAIATTGTGQNGVTDILLGSLTITTATTVAQFSKAIVDNNPDYRYGDQISYFLVKQKVNAETNIPYCQFSAVKVVLDASDNSVLEHSSGFASIDGKIGHAGNDGDCAYAWVHSRKSDNKVLVSSQSLISANSILTEYQGDIAFNMASSSYGQSTDIFLNPGSDSAGSSSTGGDDNGAGGNDTL